jgi:hypothetical protein
MVTKIKIRKHEPYLKKNFSHKFNKIGGPPGTFQKWTF